MNQHSHIRSGSTNNTEEPLTEIEQVVQRQLEAYNARKLEALLRIYSPNAELFEHPAKLLAAGSAQLRERFTARFSEPDLHARLLNRMVMSSTVVDHEIVTRNFPEGRGTLEMIMIYEVEGRRIVRAWAKSGAKHLINPAGSDCVRG